MGAKRKLTTEERQAQRLRVIRNRTYKTLRDELGIDVDVLVADDKAALAQAERNVAKLRQVGQRMRMGQSPTAPTPERRRHATAAPRTIEISPAQPVAHRFEWPLETIRDRLTSYQFEAAERLRAAYLDMQPRSAVADTTGAGGASDPSGRLAITEQMEFASREFHWIVGRLDRSMRRIVENFILESVPHGRERCLTIAEYGNKLSGMGGQNQGRAAGLTAIMLTCDRLGYLWHDYDGWKREQCLRTDRMMHSEIGQRAGRQGWIVALWAFCHRHHRLPNLQGEIDEIRNCHDREALRLRNAPPMELERYHRRRDRLTGIAFRDSDERVRVVA